MPILIAGLALTLLTTGATVVAQRTRRRLTSDVSDVRRSRDRYAGFLNGMIGNLELGIIACDEEGWATAPGFTVSVIERVCLSAHVGLKEWADREGVHYQTAWRWCRDGLMPVPFSRTPTGTIVIDVEQSNAAGGLGLYAPVSSHDQSRIWIGRSPG